MPGASILARENDALKAWPPPMWSGTSGRRASRRFASACGRQHVADEPALADRRVGHAVAPGDFMPGGGAGRARPLATVAGRLLVGAAEGEQLVGPDPGGVDDLPGALRGSCRAAMARTCAGE